jgi:hypothetical protein
MFRCPSCSLGPTLPLVSRFPPVLPRASFFFESELAARSGPGHVGANALLHFLFPNNTCRFFCLLGDTTYPNMLGHVSITNRGCLLPAATISIVHNPHNSDLLLIVHYSEVLRYI